jgi:peptidoglycan hydrolase-like amidase
MLAICASLFVAPIAVPDLPVVGVQPVAAAKGHCTDWKSESEPPPSIWVYRVSEGRVEQVDFMLYVARVTSREWNTVPGALRRAGAVAVKQYAWYYVLHYRGGSYKGQCFDVRDTTADQLYADKPSGQIPRRVWHAVRSTWNWHLVRGRDFVMTGYRRGQNVPCASDAGYHLMVRSGKKCAHHGWSAERILSVYYTARVEGLTRPA